MVTRGLRRYYGNGDVHFITWSCYRRQPHLGTAARRDLLLRVLEHAQRRHRFQVVGYVIMPEHAHLLMTEPTDGNPSVVLKVVKERFTLMLRAHERFVGPVWQKRFYDFNVCSAKKRVEKLRDLHRNPIIRGLVASAEDWSWSSYRAYAHNEQGLVYVETSSSQINVYGSHSFQPKE